MVCPVKWDKKYRKIKHGPKRLNFGASKPGVGGAGLPPPPDPLVGLKQAYMYLLKSSLDGNNLFICTSRLNGVWSKLYKSFSG